MNEKLVLAVRVLLGLGLIMFGSNKFLHFMPMPQMLPAAGEFMGALVKTGYIMPIVAVVQILSGISFLTNKFVALMAVVLFPVMLNAFLVHAVLDPGGVGGALVVTLLNITLLWANKSKYEPMLKA